MAAELVLRVKVDRSALNKLDTDIKKQRNIKVNNNLKEVGEQAKIATSHVQGLGEMLAKKIAWYSISQSIMLVVNSFKDALNTIKEVDSQLATIQKVTDFTDAQMERIKESAYEVASAYGVAAQAYLESVATFAKAGYKETATEIGELATKTQLVGDVTSSIANQFLLSVDAAWKYNGSMKELSKVLDEANTVENNYATSIEKIAIGMPNVASIASMVGMSVEETIAALGTITAVTQQTGSKASTALRALILNITGDINSTFEDSSGELVSWTDEELGTMQKFLYKYAGDVMRAADVSGELVNPIEAIRALGQALENGEVSARDMYTELSGLGGKLRTNQLVALVENYRMMDEMLGKMGTSAGSADKEISVMLDTWESKTNILKNTFAEFVEKGLSTEKIKGFVDELTHIVKVFGSLDQLLPAIAAGLAAVFAPTILKQASNFLTNISMLTGNQGLGGLAVKLSGIGSIIGTVFAGVSAAITLYTGYLGAQREAAREAHDEAVSAYEAQKSEAENVQQLYDAYLQAKDAFEKHTGTKQEYLTATQQVAEALGFEVDALDLEGKAADETAEKISNLVAQTEAAVQKQAQLAYISAQSNLKTAGRTVSVFSSENGNPIFEATKGRYEVVDEFGTEGLVKKWDTDEEAARAAYTEYVRTKKEINDLQEQLLTETSQKARDSIQDEIEQRQEWINQSEDYINAYVKARDEALSYYDNVSTGTKEATEATDELVDAEEQAALEAEDAAARMEKFAEIFDLITSGSKKATEALEAYKNATETEVTDDAAGIATAYSELLTEVGKGNYGSSKVAAGIDLLFSDDIINKFKGDTKTLADMLSNDFFKQFFVTGVDEDGEYVLAEADQIGQRFANVFKDQVANATDEAGNSIYKLGDETIATLEQTEDGWVMNVENIEALSDAMQGIDTSVLEALIESMGVKTAEFIAPTVDEIYALADASEAVHVSAEGIKQIDLARIVKDAFANGATTAEVWDLVNALTEAHEKGDINLVIDQSQVETADEEVRNLISSLGETEIPVTPYIVTYSIENAIKKAQELRDTVTPPMSGTITISSNLDSVLEKINTARRQVANPFNISTGIITSATGTDNAAGGATLVNEEGAEIIQEGGRARIAGGGQPTVTFVQKGAKIWNAKETKAILGNSKMSDLFSGIRAFASGTSAYDKLKATTSLRKSELALIEASGGSIKKQILKQKQISDALGKQISYMRKKGYSQEEINELLTEQYNIQSAINQLNKDLLNDLETAISGRIDSINEKRDEELAKIDETIDKLKKEKEEEEETLKLEQARDALANAEANRNVRYYNAATGRWEWRANASTVKSAQEALEKAEYEARISALEAQKEAVTEKYLEKTEQWQKVLESLQEPVQSIGSALTKLSKNATKDQKTTLKALNKLLKPLGYEIDLSKLYDSGGVLSGIGGIKATRDDEVVLPPDITQKMLKPVTTSVLSERLNELRYLYGVTGGAKGANNIGSIGSQYNGDSYTFGNITLTENQARNTTLYDLVQKSKGLRAYNAT